MKQEYAIEHGRPLAPPYRRVARYPFDTMKVHDSFLEPDTRRVRALRSAANYWHRKSGKRFTVRSLGEWGARCYRIA